MENVVPIGAPEEWFAAGGDQDGASLADLGIVSGDDSAHAIDPERLAQWYRRVLPADARPSLRAVAAVGGEVLPLLAALEPEPAPHERPRDVMGAGVLERRRVVNEAEDVDVQARRVASYVEKLAEQQAAVPATDAPLAITVPAPGPGTSVHEVAVDPAAEARPTLAIVETWELRSFLGDYGLGGTLQTFSLLPGERTTITMETWRSDSAKREDATSVFDSSDVAAQSRFAQSVAQETGAAHQDQGGWAVSVSTSASASAGFGIVSGSASVEAGFAANHQEASQSFSNNLSQSASDHANQVNSSRRQAVEQTSGSETASGSSTTTVREIANTNLRRVLNFVFRELNQTYTTQTVLRDIKLAYYNGRPGSRDVAPISDLRGFLARHVAPAEAERAARVLLGLCVERLDREGVPTAVLQSGHRDDGRRYTWSDAALDEEGELDYRDEVLSTDVRWRFKPGALTADDDRATPGLVVTTDEVVLRTDNIVIEALLGQADALDTYASALQSLDLQSRQADTDWRRADTRRITEALGLVASAADHAGKVDTYTRMFPDEPDISVVPVAAVDAKD